MKKFADLKFLHMQEFFKLELALNYYYILNKKLTQKWIDQTIVLLVPRSLFTHCVSYGMHKN